MTGPPSEFWYVVRSRGPDTEFLVDADDVADGGRWGPLGDAVVFADQAEAVAVSRRVPGSGATRFD